MGRPRKWKSDAERKRHERAAARNEPVRAVTARDSSPESQEGSETVVQQAALDGLLEKRQKAEALGILHGTHEAISRGESEEKMKARVKRAINYQYFLLEEGRSPA